MNKYVEKIERRIVSKEVAIALRTIGFNEWCDIYYHVDDIYEDDPESYEMGNHQVCNESFEDYHERVPAPYVIDALLWLSYKLDSYFEIKKVERGYSVFITKNDRSRAVSTVNKDQQEAIKEALDKFLLKNN